MDTGFVRFQNVWSPQEPSWWSTSLPMVSYSCLSMVSISECCCHAFLRRPVYGSWLTFMAIPLKLLLWSQVGVHFIIQWNLWYKTTPYIRHPPLSDHVSFNKKRLIILKITSNIRPPPLYDPCSQILEGLIPEVPLYLCKLFKIKDKIWMSHQQLI